MNIFKRLWLGLTTPSVDDRPEREKWWREILADLEGENARLRRDLSVRERVEESEAAGEAWRENARLRRILKMNASQVTGNEIGIVVRGDRRVAEFIGNFVNDPRNGLAGCMTRGTEGFLLRVMDMYLSALRDGDLFAVLYPDEEGNAVIRTRPRTQIAHVATDPNDWEHELWYAEAQDEEPSAEDRNNRAKWKKTWDAPAGEKTLAIPEMFHYTIDRLDGSTQGEGLAAVLLPWCRKYEDLLDSRVAVNESLAKIRWLVNMPNTDFMTRAERKRLLEAQKWDAGSFICQDPESESWEAVEATAKGGDAEPDLSAILRHIYVSGGVVPFWAGDLEMPNRAGGRSITPMALSALQADQKRYFGFLAGILSRSVEKWAWVKGHRLRDWNVTIVSADTTDYERLEAARAMKEGAQAVTTAFQAGLIEEDIAKSLMRNFAGMPEEIGETGGVTRITLSSGPRGHIGPLASNRVRRAEDKRAAELGAMAAKNEDAFQKSLRKLLDRTERELLSQIEALSAQYDEADPEDQPLLLMKLNELVAPGQEEYREALEQWLGGVYTAAAELMGKNGKPPWVSGWVQAQATALSDRHYNELKFSAVSAALRQLTTGEALQARAAAEGATRDRLASSLNDWDRLAAQFVEKLVEEGVL